MAAPATAERDERGSALEVLGAFLKLGCTSFGGPVAHLGYFRAEFVARRRWVDEATYADIVALCQLLPGPASSQTGISLGLLRAGVPGALCAWLGFSAPSAAALILVGYGVSALGGVAGAPWLHGLQIVAVAVVALAVWSMARALAPDRPRATLAVAAAVLALAAPSTAGQIGAIVLGGLIGALLPSRDSSRSAESAFHLPIGRGWALAALALFFLLLFGLPPLAQVSGSHALELVASFYRSGALVFGGGHVVLPLLQSSVVPPGWIGNDAFLAGYGAAQAVPGPLFTFAAYLGTVMTPGPNGLVGGLLCLVAIYLPSFLLLAGALPLWGAVRRHPAMQRALRGINAAVVGLLLAALYQPVWTSAITAAPDFIVALAAFLLLAFWRAPPWLVVILGAAAAEALSFIV
jgi:chromate transporter